MECKYHPTRVLLPDPIQVQLLVLRSSVRFNPALALGSLYGHRSRIWRFGNNNLLSNVWPVPVVWGGAENRGVVGLGGLILVSHFLECFTDYSGGTLYRGAGTASPPPPLISSYHRAFMYFLCPIRFLPTVLIP